MRGYVTCSSLGNYGRFANGAYQVAGVIGIARRNGMQPVFPTWRNYWHRDAFGSSEDIEIHEHLVNPLPLIPEGVEFTHRRIDWGYHEVNLLEGNWNLEGHFQSTKYFAHCLDEVKWQLKMKDEPPQNERVAIHVRLGDYDDAYHPRLDMSYYGAAISMFPDSKFLVFSDDLNGAITMLGNALSDRFDFARGGYLEDFALMKRCKHFIIGNSSYSAMAAVLGEHPEKQVVAPQPWFGPKYTDITGEDIYDKGWTVINWQ